MGVDSQLLWIPSTTLQAFWYFWKARAAGLMAAMAMGGL